MTGVSFARGVDRIEAALPTGTADARSQSAVSRTAHGVAGLGLTGLADRGTAGFALRHWTGDRLDTWFTTDPSDRRLGRRLSERARPVPELPGGRLRKLGADRTDLDWEATVDRFDDALSSLSRRLDCARHWTLRADRWTFSLANTSGARIELDGASFSLEVRAVADRRSTVRFERCSDGVEAVDVLQRLDAEAVRAVTADAARGGLEAPSGPAAIVADPKFAALLAHEIVGHPLEADIAPGLAPDHWSHTDGPVGGPALTIVDDPTALGMASVDHEGVPVRPVPLIESGHVAGRLHSLTTAGEQRCEPTGHARAAAWCDPPIPRMTATGFTGGGGPFADLVERCGDGLLLYGSRGGRCDADGTFTAVSQGSRAITGSRTGREHGPVLLRGHTRHLLAAVVAVSEDTGLQAGGEGGCGKAGQGPIETGGIGGGVLFDAVDGAVPLWR